MVVLLVVLLVVHSYYSILLRWCVSHIVHVPQFHPNVWSRMSKPQPALACSKSIQHSKLVRQWDQHRSTMFNLIFLQKTPISRIPGSWSMVKFHLFGSYQAKNTKAVNVDAGSSASGLWPVISGMNTWWLSMEVSWNGETHGTPPVIIHFRWGFSMK